MDACGVCAGDGSNCIDGCGIPNGDNSTCAPYVLLNPGGMKMVFNWPLALQDTDSSAPDYYDKYWTFSWQHEASYNADDTGQSIDQILAQCVANQDHTSNAYPHFWQQLGM